VCGSLAMVCIFGLHDSSEHPDVYANLFLLSLFFFYLF
jgi:hypothetical protein